MNLLLSLNKKLFLFFSIIFFSIIFILYFTIYFDSIFESKNQISYYEETADITKPVFSINGSNQEISVRANQGNFITDDEIMLENNVIFKSKKFKILGDNVVFNKKNLVASSKDKTKFISKNASIESSGFEIIKNGDIINFIGKTKLILK